MESNNLSTVQDNYQMDDATMTNEHDNVVDINIATKERKKLSSASTDLDK
jgi:hypothetical protein